MVESEKTMSVQPIIKMSKLSKVYNGREVINQCDLSVYEGSIYGLLGKNGAGKTTLFKLLTGLITPTTGKVELFGMDLIKDRKVLLKNIGSMIEVPVFYEHLSAIENLQIHRAYMEQDGDIEKTLEMVGLHHTGEQPVSTFSMGMKQRLGIARAIIHKPKLLILDEPINGLDPVGIREMRDLFIDLTKEHNMTMLISSHILSEIEHLADTIAIIDQGSIIEEVQIQEIKKQYPNGLEDYFLSVMNGGRIYA